MTTNSTSLLYSGRALPGLSSFSFKIRILDASQAWTAWALGSFGTGLLTDEDWASAQWIGAGKNSTVDQPILRTSFTLSRAVRSARLFITGLGNYEAYINGKRVGDTYLSPPWSQYAKRVFYDAHDITSQVVSGKNAIGIAVGKGWFGLGSLGPAEHTGAWDGNMRAKARLFITFSDGTTQTIVTNDSWKGKAGGSTCPVVTPDEEFFDAQKEPASWTAASFDASGWPNALLRTSSDTALQATPVEPVRIVEKIRAVSINNPASGVWLFDFGRNIAGFGSLTINEANGTSVTMYYGEKLSSSGRVLTTGNRYQHSTYISRGTKSTTWAPRHSYYGFRYIELTGATATPTASTVVAQRIHSGMRGAGWFTASNDVLQWIHDTTWQTMLNNIMTVPTDGSYLEKLLWLFDFAVMAETAFSSLNLKALMTKWTQDIADSQLASGDLPPWAPSPQEMAPFPSPTWGNSFPEIVWQLYQHYGDASVLSRFYSDLQAYLNYELHALGSDGLVGLESWGDWLTPSANEQRLVGTAYMYRSVTTVIDIAALLGRADDIQSYTMHAKALNSSFHEASINLPQGITEIPRQGLSCKQTTSSLSLSR